MDIRRDTQGDSIVSVNSVISSTCQAHCGANTSLLSGLHHRNVIQYQTKIIQSLQHDQCNSLQLRANRTVHVNSCNKQINATIKQTMQLQKLLENITIGLCKCVGRVCLSAQSIVHSDVLSEKINFSAHGSSNSANFGPDYLDP